MSGDTAKSRGPKRPTHIATPRQVRLVADALRNQYGRSIDVSDVKNPDSQERERAFSSRALAALVARNMAGCDRQTAAESVVDGRDDYGIDAVAIGNGVPHLWLVQAKWSQKGEAGMGVSEALKMIEGLKKIDQQSFGSLNHKLQSFAHRIKAVLDQQNARITLVMALMGTQQISADVRQRFEEAKAEFNGFGQWLDYEVLLAPDIWNIVRQEVSEPPIDLVVKMDKWFKVDIPFDAYSGVVTIGEVALWAEQHEEHLFSKNIRKDLGITPVNQGLIETLINDPHNFWYYNNGVTVLCDSFAAVPHSRSSPYGPIDIQVKGASVVNGAQTVTAAQKAMARNPMAAGTAQVSVRVIATGSAPEDLPREITKANNTQNHVERRDYVALDPTQAAIKEDFALSLEKAYVIKRGEMDPPEDGGCSVVHAATALACAHVNPEMAVRAARDLLWEDGPTGAYRILFGRQPSALQIWRSVQLLRAVRECLHKTHSKRDGRAAAVAEHAELLIAHVVFQHLNADLINESSSEWGNTLAQVQEVTERATGWMIHHVDDAFPKAFIGSIFGSPDRCRMLAKSTLTSLASITPAPALPAEYQAKAKKPRTRRPNTVAIIVDARRIKDGQALVFQPVSDAERSALTAWLEDGPNRSRASWTNHRTKPLLWAEDGKQYSPTGLVSNIWRLAEWAAAPVSVQGPAEWTIPGEGSLVDIAKSLLRESELPIDGEGGNDD